MGNVITLAISTFPTQMPAEYVWPKVSPNRALWGHKGKDGILWALITYARTAPVSLNRRLLSQRIESLGCRIFIRNLGTVRLHTHTHYKRSIETYLCRQCSIAESRISIFCMTSSEGCLKETCHKINKYSLFYKANDPE